MQPLKPVFLVTHPRSRSTAFERTFFTRTDDFTCELEIFQYPFYYGPERLGKRFDSNEEGREKAGKGFEEATFKWAIDKIFHPKDTSKRVFVKDMAKMLFPQDGSAARIAPSLRTNAEPCCDPQSFPSNPTVLPRSVLQQFQFTFLIRHPRASIPSLYRLSQPPMCYKTHWYGFRPIDAGYVELRTLFDYLTSSGIIGPAIGPSGSVQSSEGSSSTVNGAPTNTPCSICVVESDALVTNPTHILKLYCKAIGCDFRPEMLQWEGQHERQMAQSHYLVDQGFHDRVLESRGLGQGSGFEAQPPESLDECEVLWAREFGDIGAKTIRACVEKNIPHYEYLKRFALG